MTAMESAFSPETETTAVPEHLDVATALLTGARDGQEDTVIADCPQGGDLGLVVLSDGMGGQNAGEVASALASTDVYCNLKCASRKLVTSPQMQGSVLRRAANEANACLRDYIAETPDAAGMGATLVAGIIQGGGLWWVSIGDSPLYLFRAGTLFRLNEDHSFGAVLEDLVEQGMIEQSEADRHPDRTRLTSVLMGDAIERMDCPSAPYALESGDVILFASDGLGHLDEVDLEEILGECHTAGAAEIAGNLIQAIKALDDPAQDNVALAVLRYTTGLSQAEVEASIQSSVAALFASVGE